mmetsp:Transcript_36442/g.67879  ORF Transcript_36442/g.67879 Transcript_36442/m.67879 type:complete len:334 (+) Transcript_36442:40-1041(+)
MQYKNGTAIEQSRPGQAATMLLCPYCLEAKEVGEESFLLLFREFHAERKQLGKSRGEVLEEQLLVLGVGLHVRAELGRTYQAHVGGQHHELATRVLQLSRAGPFLAVVGLLGGPLLLQQQTEVLIGEGGLGVGPGAPVAGRVLVAAPHRMRARQTNNLLVIKSHAVEDVSEVLDIRSHTARVRRRQATIRNSRGLVGVSAAASPGNGRAAHLLNGSGTGQSPQVSIAHRRILFLDGFEEVTRTAQAGVSAPHRLRGEAHGGTVAAASAVLFRVSARSVPRKANQSTGHGGAIASALELSIDGRSDVALDSLDVNSVRCRLGHQHGATSNTRHN